MSLFEFFWVLSLVTGVASVLLQARLRHLDTRKAYAASVATLLGALLGALLLGLHDYGAPASWNPFTMGKSFSGGLLGGVLAAIAFCRLLRLPLLAYGDALVCGLALAYPVGRAGCFFNGCDYGVLSSAPWSVTYGPGTEAFAEQVLQGMVASNAVSSLPVHPVQLYAAGFGLLIALLVFKARPGLAGRRLFLYFFLYGLYRFSIEPLRGDYASGFAGISLPQFVALLSSFAGALGLFKIRAPREQPVSKSSRAEMVEQEEIR